MKRMLIGVLLFVCVLTPAAGAAYIDVVQAMNPIHWWRLGEAPGSTTMIDQVGALHGQYVNGVTLGYPGGVSGDPDTAAWFYPNYAVTPHGSSLLLDAGSVSFLFRDTGSIRNQGLISKDSSGYDTGGHMTIYTNGYRDKIKVRLQSDHSSHYLSSEKIELDRWYHVVFSWGDQGMRLFMDGEHVDSDSYTGGLGATSGDIGNFEPLVFGASSWGSGNASATPIHDKLSGALDEIMFFDRQLTDTEIEHLNDGVNGNTSTVVVPAPLAMSVLLPVGLLVGRRARRYAS